MRRFLISRTAIARIDLMVLFEVCVDSVSSASAARAGGASRVELCDALSEGGLTPSLGKIEAVVRAAAPLPVYVLVRPRAGDFCYSPDELRVMARDVEVAAGAGAAGIVLGVLQPDGVVDEARTRELFLIAKALGLRCTFHRAVDAARDVVEAGVAAARVGADAILTSGGAATALAGAATIRALCDALAAAGAEHVQVIAGGGISAENAGALVAAARVGAVHASARAPPQPGAMQFIKDPPVAMGGTGAGDAFTSEYCVRVATEATVSAIRMALPKS